MARLECACSEHAEVLFNCVFAQEGLGVGYIQAVSVWCSCFGGLWAQGLLTRLHTVV
jgi:hypothetical protein